MKQKLEDKARLAYEVTGKRGGAPKHTPDTGSVKVIVDDAGTISVDAYQGFGETYTRRETTLITVHSNKFGDVYRGTFDGIAAILHSAQLAPDQVMGAGHTEVAELPAVGESGEPETDIAAALSFGDVLE